MASRLQKLARVARSSMAPRTSTSSVGAFGRFGNNGNGSGYGNYRRFSSGSEKAKSRFALFSGVAVAVGVVGMALFGEKDKKPIQVQVQEKIANSVQVHASTQLGQQPSVISGTKEHAAYVWIHLSPNADVKECARIAANYASVVDEVVPPKDRDEDNEIVAGVAFGPAVWKKLGGFAPQAFDYAERRHDVGNMPSTGGDIFFHFKSHNYGVCFDAAQSIVRKFPKGAIASVEDNYGFVYRNGRDLSGFIDGTENPAAEEDRADAALIGDNNDARGGSYLITQRWVHQFDKIQAASVADQEGFVGRTKDNSVELDPKTRPKTSHVSRMVGHDKNGKKINIVRQSMPYTRGADSGLFFIAYARSPDNFNFMLDRMTGQTADKLHDDVMRMTKCISGNYWYVPSQNQLAKLR